MRVDQWVRADFGLELTAWHPAGGSDSAATVWHAWADDGRQYAVKWTSGGTAAGILVPATLAVPGTPVHVRTVDGHWWSERDGKRLSVTLWVDDAATDRTPADWIAVGALLRRVHDSPVESAPELSVDRGETTRATDAVAAVESVLGAATDDLGRAAAVVWTTHLPDLAAALALAESLRPAGPAVVCHGDPHLGNVVRGPDGPVLVDWDDAVVAPPERDLALLLGGMGTFGARTTAERGWLLEGYRATPDPDRLTFFRCVRAVEDAGLWSAVALDPAVPRADRIAALGHARAVVGPGGLLRLALA